MTASIELLPDDRSDAVIRAQWTALSDAGLPSRGDLHADTNRPHATLLAAPAIDAGALDLLAPVAMRLPLTCRLGAPIVFGSGGHRTLARLVVPSAELLSVHATVLRLLGPIVGDAFAHSDPGQWTPHLTLARRLDAGSVAAALDVLPADDVSITFGALRQWDGDTKTARTLSGRAC